MFYKVKLSLADTLDSMQMGFREVALLIVKLLHYRILELFIYNLMLQIYRVIIVKLILQLVIKLEVLQML